MSERCHYLAKKKQHATGSTLKMIQLQEKDILQKGKKGFKQVTWNFSEKSHGKGAPDGVGGAVKRIADSSVNMGVDIQTPEEFYRFLKERQASSKVKFFWVCEEDIRKYDESVPEVVPLALRRGASMSILLGAPKFLETALTMGIHQILSTEPGTILHRELSCFCSRPDICQCYKTTKISFQTSSAEASVNVQQDLTGKFVIVRYEEQPFVGQVLQVFDEELEILMLSSKERTLKYGEMKLQFFPDLTSDMAKRRATFGEIREKLRSAGVKHGIIHPATLIITLGNETRRFTHHKKAEAYLDAVEKPPKPN
ncbi:unnamed protein product [Boreogadus saida]